jgi:hypothetical protein
MRCAAIHRKLGTHISKVKSLSMDSWNNDQVEVNIYYSRDHCGQTDLTFVSEQNMKRIGNVSSNKTYNPQNKRPPVPIDADEADSAMERFIRSKYVGSQSRSASNGAKKNNTGSSDEGTPPPLPPKTGSRFFKSGTLSFRSKKEQRSPRESSFPQFDPQTRDEHLRNKPSKVFGASVHHDSLEDTAQKLTQLRDMGFADDKRNAMILKGVNGNLEKTVEALVRLGEGGGSISPAITTMRDPLSRSVTPKPAKPATNGLSTVNLSKPSPPLPVQSPSSPSNDPWEISPAQPQSSQSTGTIQNKNPFYNHNTNTNPFGVPNQRTTYDLNQSLQNLSVSTPSQPPLFPHHTGGAPASQPISQQAYQHPMTPPVPQIQNFASAAFNSHITYPQPSQTPQARGYNPFLQTPMVAQQPLSLNTSQYQQQTPLATNPFARSPTRINPPMLNQIPEQSQQNVYDSPQTHYSPNPFMSMNQAAQAPQPSQQQWYQSQQPTYAMLPNYLSQQSSKEAIMALYGNSQYTPALVQSPTQVTSNPFETSQTAPSQPQPQPQLQVPQPNPVAGGKNPFLTTTTASTNPAASSARSRDSVMLGNEMAWNNGRHSPDAFASLSARSGF